MSLADFFKKNGVLNSLGEHADYFKPDTGYFDPVERPEDFYETISSTSKSDKKARQNYLELNAQFQAKDEARIQSQQSLANTFFEDTPKQSFDFSQEKTSQQQPQPETKVPLLRSLFSLPSTIEQGRTGLMNNLSSFLSSNPADFISSQVTKLVIPDRWKDVLGRTIGDHLKTIIPDATAKLNKASVFDMSTLERTDITRQLVINKGIPENQVDDELIAVAKLESDINKSSLFAQGVIGIINNLTGKNFKAPSITLPGENQFTNMLQNKLVDFFDNKIAKVELKTLSKKEKNALTEASVFEGLMDNTGHLINTFFFLDAFNGNKKEERTKALQEWASQYDVSEKDVIDALEGKHSKRLENANLYTTYTNMVREQTWSDLDLANDKTAAYVYQVGGSVIDFAAVLGAFALSKNPQALKVLGPLAFSFVDTDEFDMSVDKAMAAGQTREEALINVAKADSTRRQMVFITEYIGFDFLFHQFQGGRLVNGVKNFTTAITEEIVQNLGENVIDKKYLDESTRYWEDTLNTILYSLPVAFMGGAIGAYGGFTIQEKAEMRARVEEEKNKASNVLQESLGITKETADNLLSVMIENYSQAQEEFKDLILVDPEVRKGMAQEYTPEGQPTSEEITVPTNEELISSIEMRYLPQAKSLNQIAAPIEMLGLPEGTRPSILPNNQGTFRQATTDFDLTRRIEFAVTNKDYTPLVEKAAQSASFEDFLDSLATVYKRRNNSIEFDNLRSPNTITIKGLKNPLGTIELSDRVVKFGEVTARQIESFVNNSSLSNIEIYEKILPFLNADGLIVNKIDPVPQGMDYIQLKGNQMVIMPKPDKRINPVDFLKNVWSKKYYRDQVNYATLGATPVRNVNLTKESSLLKAKQAQQTELMAEYTDFVTKLAEEEGLNVKFNETTGAWKDFETGEIFIEPSRGVRLSGRGMQSSQVKSIAEKIRAEYDQDSVLIVDQNLPDNQPDLEIDNMWEIEFFDPNIGYELSMKLSESSENGGYDIGGFTFDNKTGIISTIEYGSQESIHKFILDNIDNIKNYEKRQQQKFLFTNRPSENVGSSSTSEGSVNSVSTETSTNDTGREGRTREEETGNTRLDEERSEVSRKQSEQRERSEDNRVNSGKQEIDRTNQKKSVLAERINENLKDASIDETYDPIEIKDQLDIAANKIENNYAEAYREAMTDRGNTIQKSALLMELSQLAERDGDIKSQVEILSRFRALGTQTAQALNMLKAYKLMNPQAKYLDDVISAKLENIKWRKESLLETKKRVYKKGEELKRKTKEAFKEKDLDALFEDLIC